MKNIELSKENKIYLENKLNEFLNETLFNSDLLKDDNEDLEITLEEQSFKYLIELLNEKIEYY